MKCKKCSREIPEGAPFCCWCGKPQERQKQKTHRRAKGTGTIRKDSRYASPWIAVAPPAAKGTQGKYIGAYKTRAEAQQALDLYHAEKFPELYNADLAKIYELWSEKHFETLASENGRSGYKAAYSDLAPLQRKKMREIKTADFQFCIDKVAEKYSRSKCEKVRQLCSQLCKYAMQNDIIDKNYAQFIVLPKEEKKEKVIFTSKELDALWERSNDNRVRFILFMIYTGFRIGEVSEIVADKVHLNDGYIIGGLKTEAGKNRIVPLPPKIPEIAEFVKYWLEEPQNSPFGVPKNSLRQYWFYPALSDLGIIDPPMYNEKTRKNEYKNPRITPHATRHTFASLSAAAGMRPDDLQKIIGHASYETTAEIYVHSDLKTLKNAMQKLER
jgi:integrase